MRLTGVIAAVALGLCGLAAGAGDDWPKWLGPKSDGISRETGLADKWPEGGPKKLWSAPAGKGYSSPVAADGKVYLFSMVANKDTLTCLNADDGKEVWSKSTSSGWTGAYPGTRTTPTIEADRIYTYGGAGELVCWNLADGKPLWNLNVLKEAGGRDLKWGAASSPTIVGDLVYVQGGNGGAVAAAVNKNTGKVAWLSEAKGLGSYATVVPVDKQVVVFGGNGVVGMDAATGKTLWTSPWKTSWDVHASTPLYHDGHLFVTSGYNVGCMMLKYAGPKAEKLWDKKEPHSKHVAPILDGGHLYVNSEGKLMCLSWPDGKEKWTKGDLGIGIGGSFVRVGDKLVVLTERGQLLLVQATPEGCSLISKAPLFSGGENWSTPMIYRGKLYVKGPTELVCLDIKAP